MIHMTEEIIAVESFKETPEKIASVLHDFTKQPVKDEEIEKRDKWTSILSIRQTDNSYGLLIKNHVEKTEHNTFKLLAVKSTIQDYLSEKYSLNASISVLLEEHSSILIFIPLSELNGHLLNEIITYCANEVESCLNSKEFIIS